MKDERKFRAMIGAEVGRNVVEIRRRRIGKHVQVGIGPKFGPSPGQSPRRAMNVEVATGGGHRLESRRIIG